MGVIGSHGAGTGIRPEAMHGGRKGVWPGYVLTVAMDGSWSLATGTGGHSTSLASGQGGDWTSGQWIELSLSVIPPMQNNADPRVTAIVNGKTLAAVEVPKGSVGGAVYL